MAAVYASTVVSVEANEWTLVLQRFGGEARGLYICHGLDEGQTLSLDIGQSEGGREGGREGGTDGRTDGRTDFGVGCLVLVAVIAATSG